MEGTCEAYTYVVQGSTEDFPGSSDSKRICLHRRRPEFGSSQLKTSLGWEDALEKGMATHSSILAWRIP